MWCTSCGTQAPSDVRFCPACGARQPVPAAESVTAPWQGEPSPAAAPPAPLVLQQPAPVRRSSRGLRIALPLAAAAGAVVIGVVVTTGMFSGPDLTPGSTNSPVPSGTPVSSAEDLLAIAEGTGAENCQALDYPSMEAAYAVYCSPAGGSLFNVNFSAYADPDAFDRNTPTSGVYGVPGEDEDCSPGRSFTGTWDQDGRGGVLACTMGPGAYTLIWTENSRLLVVGFNVVDPEQEATDAQVEAAYEWWQDNATLN